MGISWRDSADALRDMIRQQGSDPDRMESPESAWRVFCAFLAVEVDGLETVTRTGSSSSQAAPLRAVPAPITDPDTLARLDVRRSDRLGGIIHEYQHAA